MPTHESPKKEMRKTAKRREANRYYRKTTANLMKRLLASSKKKEAEELLPKVVAHIDKLAKRHVIHQNKAAHWKSKVMQHVQGLS